ncbi:TPA_asm: FtsK [Powellomyces chytrid fungus MELD virus 2]|uniref:Uncharacterized protein n=1 Tax=Powellomyces hirtus TaxID=109895 RepID=A0A507DQW9_9FUNG|nr:hypothetical protein PhCBS80983_g06318 [Powellomyces hirtus]DAC81645.1 TPA_asm: FtsK [Powellomyces chytrid fungus MELD virus 2]
MTYKPRAIYSQKKKKRDPRIPLDLQDPPLCTTVISPRLSGKSALICGLIEDVYAKVFDRVILMSDTILYDRSIKELAKQTRHKNIYFTDEVSNASIKEILEEQKKLAEDGKTLLFFIDDSGDNARSKELNKELSKLYTKGRHFLCSTIVCIQSVSGQLTRKMKANTTEFIIFKNNSKDMEALAKLLTSAYKTKKEVLAYLTERTREPYAFCYINLAADDAKGMYRYCDKDGFHDYFP